MKTEVKQRTVSRHLVVAWLHPRCCPLLPIPADLISQRNTIVRAVLLEFQKDYYELRRLTEAYGGGPPLKSSDLLLCSLPGGTTTYGGWAADLAAAAAASCIGVAYGAAGGMLVPWDACLLPPQGW